MALGSTFLGVGREMKRGVQAGVVNGKEMESQDGGMLI